MTMLCTQKSNSHSNHESLGSETYEISFPAVNTRLAEDFDMLQGRIAAISIFTGKGYKVVPGKETSSDFCVWCYGCDTRCSFRLRTKEYVEQGVPHQLVVEYNPHSCGCSPEQEHEDPQKVSSVAERNQKSFQTLLQAAAKFCIGDGPYNNESNKNNNDLEKLQWMIVKAYGMDAYTPANRDVLSRLLVAEKRNSGVPRENSVVHTTEHAIQFQQMDNDRRMQTKKTDDLEVGLLVCEESSESVSSPTAAVLTSDSSTEEEDSPSHFKVTLAEAQDQNVLATRSVTPDMKTDNKSSSSQGKSDSTSEVDSSDSNTDDNNTVVDPPVPPLEREYSDKISDDIFGVGIIPASHWSVRARRNASVVKKEVGKEGVPKAETVRTNKKRRRTVLTLKIRCDSSVMGSIKIPQDFIQPTTATKTKSSSQIVAIPYKTVRGPIGRMVEQIDLSTGSVLARFKSQRAAERETNIDRKAIAKVLMGESTQVGGYGWRVSESGHDSVVAPKTIKKSSREQLPRPPIKDKTVLEKPKKKAKRSHGINLAIFRNSLNYKVLLDEYQLFVDQGMCESVDFGSSLGAAKRAIREKLDTLNGSFLEDPEITAELKEFRKSLRQIQRFEDQEILSIQMERLEWLEGKSTARANLSLKEKRKLKAIEYEKRSFHEEPLRFTESSQVDDCNLCDCNCNGPCDICPAGFPTSSVRVDSLAPQVRRVNFFSLIEEEEEEAEEARGQSENSAIALKSLMHSLEFMKEEKKAI
eukprot:scaffold3402_cov169-Amphora_coffeaeformis.AAC.18